MSLAVKLIALKTETIEAIRRKLLGVDLQAVAVGQSVRVLKDINDVCRKGDTGMVDAIEADMAHVLLDLPQDYNSFPFRFISLHGKFIEIETTDRVLDLEDGANTVSTQDGRCITKIGLNVENEIWVEGHHEETNDVVNDGEEHVLLYSADSLVKLFDAVTAVLAAR